MGRHCCVDPEHDIDHEFAATLRQECQQAMDLEFVKLRTENIFHLPTTQFGPVSPRSGESNDGEWRGLAGICASGRPSFPQESGQASIRALFVAINQIWESSIDQM